MSCVVSQAPSTTTTELRQQQQQQAPSLPASQSASSLSSTIEYTHPASYDLIDAAQCSGNKQRLVPARPVRCLAAVREIGQTRNDSILTASSYCFCFTQPGSTTYRTPNAPIRLSCIVAITRLHCTWHCERSLGNVCGNHDLAAAFRRVVKDKTLRQCFSDWSTKCSDHLPAVCGAALHNTAAPSGRDMPCSLPVCHRATHTMLCVGLVTLVASICSAFLWSASTARSISSCRDRLLAGTAAVGTDTVYTAVATADTAAAPVRLRTVECGPQADSRAVRCICRLRLQPTHQHQQLDTTPTNQPAGSLVHNPPGW